jgi:hypothetical protein
MGKARIKNFRTPALPHVIGIYTRYYEADVAAITQSRTVSYGGENRLLIIIQNGNVSFFTYSPDGSPSCKIFGFAPTPYFAGKDLPVDMDNPTDFLSN